MASSARRIRARPLPRLGVTFVRWSFARGAFWRGYWLLASVYLVEVADLPASQLVLIGVGQSAVVLVAELPAGVYADSVSRRRSLVVAHVITGVGMVVLGLVTSFPALAWSQALCGLGWAFASGADVAWITDELDDPGATSRVLAVRARWELIGAAAGLIGFGCVGWATDLRTGIVASGLMMLALGGVVAVRFPERHLALADSRRRWRAGIWVNRRTTSGVRATVHSLLAFSEHVGEIVFGGALAVVAATGGLTASIVGAAALLALAGGLVTRARPRRAGVGSQNEPRDQVPGRLRSHGVR